MKRGLDSIRMSFRDLSSRVFIIFLSFHSLKRKITGKDVAAGDPASVNLVFCCSRGAKIEGENFSHLRNRALSIMTGPTELRIDCLIAWTQSRSRGSDVNKPVFLKACRHDVCVSAH